MNLPDTCPRCDESYLERRLPSDIGIMSIYKKCVICHHDGMLYFHYEHSRL